jgi:DNA-binding phage protein
MNETTAIQALRRAAQRRAAADGERHAASIELRKRVQEAHKAGIGPTRIAEAAGLSRQAVYEALAERPS